MDKKKIILIAIVCALVLAVIAAVLIIGKLRAGGEEPVKTFQAKTAGRDFGSEDLNEFHYTYCFTGYPPEYLKYKLYTEDGRHMFYYEWRDESTFSFSLEGPPTAGCTEELTDEQWQEFWSCLEGGTVKSRSENNADGGDGGPEFYLYWNGDKGDIQEFSFATAARREKFEELSRNLAPAQDAQED